LQGKVFSVSVLVASALIFLTVLSTLSLGVLLSYAALSGILLAFSRPKPEPAPALLARAHAAGD
jgi:hypothetical protein